MQQTVRYLASSIQILLHNRLVCRHKQNEWGNCTIITKSRKNHYGDHEIVLLKLYLSMLTTRITSTGISLPLFLDVFIVLLVLYV